MVENSQRRQRGGSDRTDVDDLWGLLQPVVTGLGYELVGIERVSLRSGSMLRIYADKESGITVEDCARISEQVSGLLNVSGAIGNRYTLEVSSPGLDRRLFIREHYEKFAGRHVKMRLLRTVNGRRKLVGTLAGLEGDDVAVLVEGKLFRVPLDLVDVARLVPSYL
ncbi:MAG: ribosome maturation factor RimP [Gammaproteobacteria bacterium]